MPETIFYENNFGILVKPFSITPLILVVVMVWFFLFRPSDIDPGHIGRIPDAFRVWRGHQRAYFDR